MQGGWYVFEVEVLGYEFGLMLTEDGKVDEELVKIVDDIV